MTRKSRPWKEAPLFYLIGLLASAIGTIIGVAYYISRVERDGWLNEHFPETVLYGFLLIYFMIGAKSGEGESEAIEETLEEDNKK